MTPAEEIADLDERIRLLRAASRPSEPLDERAEALANWTGEPLPDVVKTTAPSRPTAQGHILSALSQLERRRALLQCGRP